MLYSLKTPTSKVSLFIRYAIPTWIKVRIREWIRYIQDRFLSLLLVRLSLYLAVVAAAVAFLVVDTLDDSRRLVSACGVVALLIIGVVLSKHPTKIRWRQVIHLPDQPKDQHMQRAKCFRLFGD